MSDDLRIVIQSDEGPVAVYVSRAVMTKLTGRTHLTPEEAASACRVEIEDIARAKLRGSGRTSVRLDASDF